MDAREREYGQAQGKTRAPATKQSGENGMTFHAANVAIWVKLSKFAFPVLEKIAKKPFLC